MSKSKDDIDAVLRFWFIEKGTKDWFKKDPALDQEIRDKFAKLVEDAKKHNLDHWADSPRGRLALIILLDQFSRNIYRDTPESFAGDPLSLKLALEGIALGVDKDLTTDERSFFYTPLMHSERNDMQELSIQKFEELSELGSKNIKWARTHKDVIDMFGRFPHRNKILGRESTEEELVYLKKPEAGF